MTTSLVQQAGNYAIDARLGTTPTGDLYVAVHRVLRRRVLVKVLHEQVPASRPFALRLLREACILDALPHPGVPRVYECGVLRDRRPWFAFESFAGETVANRIARQPVPSGELVAIVRGVAEVLAYAQARGITHGGLRPAHVVIGEQRAQITDWSHARTFDADTSEGLPPPLSDPRYTAPELFPGDASPAGDVFALGVIAYQLATGRRPAGPSSQVGSPLAARLRSRTPPVTRELAELIDRMLDADPNARITASEVVDHFEGDVTEGRSQHADEDRSDEQTQRIRLPRWTPSITPSGVEPSPPGAPLVISRLRR